MAFRFLIVDDSPVLRRFILRAIEASGLECEACLEAGDGEEALAVLGRESVDAILTDVNMPEMDGEKFLRRLADNGELRTVPVLVISTDGSDKRVRQMLGIGASDYLTKPFLPEELRERLERLLEGRNG